MRVPNGEKSSDEVMRKQGKACPINRRVRLSPYVVGSGSEGLIILCLSNLIFLAARMRQLQFREWILRTNFLHLLSVVKGLGQFDGIFYMIPIVQ